MAQHLIGHVEGTEISTVEELQVIMEDVAEQCSFNVVAKAFHQFEPYGATGVFVLAESHFSVHSYPEDEKVYVDVFCCSPTFDPMRCAKIIETSFMASRGSWQVVQRL